ncbi:MAG: MFS transporter [Pandoraea sp.]|nr:MFS transporter [Pandoraea sp.]MDR3397586.1 MFS transporter [Pandoraea sp.]
MSNLSAALPESIAPQRKWLSLGILLVGNFVTILDLFIVNVALPGIQTGLHASEADLQLVMVAYSLAYGLCLMNGAKLGDMFGRRRLYLIGMGIFTIASASCGLALTPLQLVVARLFQGMGAGVLMPQVLASMRVLFEGDERRKAFGIMGATQGGAAALSQLLGGLLISYGPGDLGWRLVFLINVPIGVLAIVMGRRLLLETKASAAASLDVRGALALTVGLLLILVPVTEGREAGWPWWSVVLPLLAAPVLAYFVRYERALQRAGGVPIFDPSLFSVRQFAAGTGGVFFFYSAISSFFLSLTLLLQFGLGLTPLQSGIIFTPTALAFFCGSMAAPRLSARFGRRALLGGALVFGTGLAMTALVALIQPGNVTWLVVSLIFNGAGQGTVIPLAFNAILGSVREEQAGMGGGALSTMQTVGTSCGVVVVGILLFSQLGASAHGSAELRAIGYGHALAVATLYNVGAVLASFVLFRYATSSSRR